MSKKNCGFDTKDMDTSVRAQDDFYRYAHGSWLKKAKIPANEVRWGSFIMSRVENEKRIKRIVDELAKKKRYPAGSPEQMIQDFYRSATDEARREKLGITPIKPYLARIEKIKSVKDMLTYLAEEQRDGSSGIWGAFVDQDSKDSERYVLHFYQSGLGMPERDYYLKDDVESKRVRDAYMKHIEKLHLLMGDAPAAARKAREVVMQIETALAKASMSKEDVRDAEKTYHKLSLAALVKIAPEVDWNRFLKIIGAAKSPYVIAMQPEFLKAAGTMLKNVSIEHWKTYLRFHLINSSANVLSKKFLREAFDFYNRVLTGQKQMKPLWRRALAATSGSLGELLGQIYVKRYFSPEAKSRMNGLVDDLFTAYAARIKNLQWMDASTKKKALKKLSMVSRKIGYPDKWKSYKGLVVKADDFFGNLERSSTYEMRRNMKKLGKPINRGEWHMYPQTVNAYCNFNLNEIVFPAGILQPPFFDLAADDAINYGCIGSVIGHEITHAFDDQGSKFDGKGNMKSWWTKEDRTRFDAKAKIVKEQFDQFKVADGVPVNGQLTLGENIADLGGVSISYDAYQLALARSTERQDIEGLTPEQRFFLAFTIFDLIIARPEFEKMQVLTDPHSPAQFRINGPLANLPEFYMAFDVKEGDKLYREPKDRAKIW